MVANGDANMSPATRETVDEETEKFRVDKTKGPEGTGTGTERSSNRPSRKELNRRPIDTVDATRLIEWHEAHRVRRL